MISEEPMTPKVKIKRVPVREKKKEMERET